jgi:hypothetical protein
MSPSRLLILSLATVVSGGCADPVRPFSSVSTRVEAEPGASASSVLLRAIATNHGGSSLELGYGCGSGLDFRVRLPTGEMHDLLRGLPSICLGTDSNLLEPGETDTVAFVWTAPASGTYRVEAGIRTASGTEALSSPLFFAVP